MSMIHKLVQTLLSVSLITSFGFMLNPVKLRAQGGGSGQQPRTGSTASHSIRGKIFLPTGQSPELRMRVVLEVSTGGIIGETFSDSVGNFEFSMSFSNCINPLPKKLSLGGGVFSQTLETHRFPGKNENNAQPKGLDD